MKNSGKIREAKIFGREKHKEQKRKWSGLPYHTHTEEVAEIVASVTDDEDMIEDTNTSYSELYEIFGQRVADLVFELTDVYTPEAFLNLNRKQRKEREAARLWAVSPEAQTIKYADFISNTKDILKNDPDFAIVYVKEKERILEGMTRGDKGLLERAKASVAAAKK